MKTFTHSLPIQFVDMTRWSDIRNADYYINRKTLGTLPLPIILIRGQSLQTVLLGLAFAVTVLRCWVRLFLEHRNLTNPDYLVWAGWFCTLGWVVCSVVALHLQIDHPLVEPDLTTDSIQYLKVNTRGRSTLTQGVLIKVPCRPCS